MNRKMICALGQFKDSPLQKIPKDWDIVSLKDEINVLHGYAFVGDYFTDSPPGEVLLVPGNFHREGGIYFNDNNTKYYHGLIPDGTLLNNGDLLIVMTDLSPRTLILGRVVQLQLPFRVLHNQRIGKIVPKLPNTWDKRFLMLVINSDRVRSNIISNATGTTVRHTSPDRITANVVPKPSVREQSKIADIIDTIDAAIAHTEALIHKLKQIKAGLLHDLLTCGLDENGELRDAIAHPEQFKDSPLGRIPKNWEIKLLKAIADLQVGFAFKSEWFREDEGVRLLRGENVGYGTPDWSETRKLSWKMYPNYREYELVAGDIIIGMDRTFTKSGFKISVLETLDVPALLVQRVGRFLAIDCEQKFLKALLNSQRYQSVLFAQQKGMDIPHLSKSEILEPLVAVPSIKEQRRIAAVINTHDTRIRTEEAYLDKLKQQKKGLMHDLLTGKVQVNTAKN